MNIKYGVNAKDGYYVEFSCGTDVQMFTKDSNNILYLKNQVNPILNTNINWYKVFKGEEFGVEYLGKGSAKKGARIISFEAFEGEVDTKECALARIEAIKEKIKNSAIWEEGFEYDPYK